MRGGCTHNSTQCMCQPPSCASSLQKVEALKAEVTTREFSLGQPTLHSLRRCLDKTRRTAARHAADLRAAVAQANADKHQADDALVAVSAERNLVKEVRLVCAAPASQLERSLKPASPLCANRKCAVPKLPAREITSLRMVCCEQTRQCLIVLARPRRWHPLTLWPPFQPCDVP